MFHERYRNTQYVGYMLAGLSLISVFRVYKMVEPSNYNIVSDPELKIAPESKVASEPVLV